MAGVRGNEQTDLVVVLHPRLRLIHQDSSRTVGVIPDRPTTLTVPVSQ
jgi:hypothetical protein